MVRQEIFQMRFAKVSAIGLLIWVFTFIMGVLSGIFSGEFYEGIYFALGLATVMCIVFIIWGIILCIFTPEDEEEKKLIKDMEDAE